MSAGTISAPCRKAAAGLGGPFCEVPEPAPVTPKGAASGSAGSSDGASGSTMTEAPVMAPGEAEAKPRARTKASETSALRLGGVVPRGTPVDSVANPSAVEVPVELPTAGGGTAPAPGVVGSIAPSPPNSGGSRLPGPTIGGKALPTGARIVSMTPTMGTTTGLLTSVTGSRPAGSRTLFTGGTTASTVSSTAPVTGLTTVSTTLPTVSLGTTR